MFTEELLTFFALASAKSSKDALKEKEFVKTRAEVSGISEILVLKNNEILRNEDIKSMAMRERLTINALNILMLEIGARSSSIKPLIFPVDLCFTLLRLSASGENIVFPNFYENQLKNSNAKRKVFIPFFDSEHFRLIYINRAKTTVNLYDSGAEKFADSNYTDMNIKILILVRKCLKKLYKMDFKGLIPKIMQQNWAWDCGHNVLSRAQFLLDTAKSTETDIEVKEFAYFCPESILKFNFTLLDLILTKIDYPDSKIRNLYVIKENSPMPKSTTLSLDSKLWKRAKNMGELKTIFKKEKLSTRAMWQILKSNPESVRSMIKEFRSDRHSKKRLEKLVRKNTCKIFECT